MRMRRRPEGGFTLLEVIVAMALFAAGIVAVINLFSGALRLSAGSRDAFASTIYARQRMEEALLVPNPVEGVERGTFGDNYRWEVATSLAPQEEEKPYDEIRLHVTVRWDDAGDERAMDLSATRWRWKGTGGGDLAMGGDRKPTGSESGSGAFSEPGSAPGSGGDPSGESSGSAIRRRLRR